MRNSFVVVGGLMMWAAVAGCTSRKPASGFDLSMPEKTFAAWVQAVETYDERGARELFSARSAKAEALRDDIVEAMFSTRHFRRVMEAWFPRSREYIVEDPGDEAHMQALRDFATSMRITMDGDRATVSQGAVVGAPTWMAFLIRRGGEWQFDLDRSPGVEAYPAGASWRAQHQAALAGVELRDVARQVERGNLTSVEAVKKALAAQMNGAGGGG